MTAQIVTAQNRFHNMSDVQLADMLGENDARAKAFAKEADAIKTELKARKVEEAVGQRFTVKISESLRETADTKALQAHFGEDWGRWTKIAYVQTVTLKAVDVAAVQQLAA